MSAIDEVLARNAAFQEEFANAALQRAPARHIAIVACMDARLDPKGALGLAPGDAHIIRNAGGVITDDAIRSLVVSQRKLGTREIMLIHHTDCGMLNLDEAEFADEITRDTGDKPDFAFHGFANLEDSVRESMQTLLACPFLPHRDAIRGFVYEVESGRLREVV
jgi:carbonic anhydrase